MRERKDDLDDKRSPSITCGPGTLLRRRRCSRLDERVSPAFAHDKRGGEDDSWIYAYDARNIGTELPYKRLGPWDFRRAAKANYAAITRKLWMPAAPAKGTRPVTREEIDQRWREMIGAVRDPRGYALWQVPVWTAKAASRDV